MPARVLPPTVSRFLDFYKFSRLFFGKFSMFIPDMIPTVPAAHDQM